MNCNPIYIVIHGHGATLTDAVTLPKRVLEFECFWIDGVFHVPKPISLPLRRLLSEGEDDNVLFTALRKLAVSRMLAASLSPVQPPEDANLAEFNERSIIDNFPSFAIPFGHSSRKNCAERLRKEGGVTMLELLGKGECADNLDSVLSELSSTLIKDDGERMTENEAAASLVSHFGSSEFVEQLKELRDMEETGGDLDTVASAVFYARALSASAKAEGKNIDYKFVFVNYHEGLLGLSDLPPGDIYMADMPISTIPDLPGDLRSLAEAGFKLVRYEDHHPYAPTHAAMLEELQKEGLIGFQAMSGPLIDPNAESASEELPESELKCGADMVYEALVLDTPCDSPAMSHLRTITHSEDFASDRKPLGKIITELIKGGICKVDLAQTLLRCDAKEDILRNLNDKGWYEWVQTKRFEALEIADRFMEHAQLLEIERPEMGQAEFSGPALDDGSDMPVVSSNRKEDQNSLRILVALAPKTKRGEPKLNIGKACEYFADKIPGLDYLFFCYGASIVVGRRLNQADTSLNLSTLFKKIGTEKDGGHSGASVCSPENNPLYPRNILGRVSSANFTPFCRYLTERISGELDVAVKARNDISVKASPSSNGGKSLLYLLIGAILAGLLVLLLNRDYREKNIIKGNTDLLPMKTSTNEISK
ncbi:MAG: hypothetical protein KAG97_07160 [Victivallales bacterium]|nr:hypothetical protein [Victivallales bacterium]